jgi:hypothetical protein
MDIVEVPAQRLALLEKVEKLANGLFNDPKNGMMVKAAFKEKYPDAILPEVDAFNAAQNVKKDVLGAVDDRIKGLNDTMTKFIDEQKLAREAANKEREENDFARQCKDAQDRYRLTDAGMQAVFQRMKDMNNPDAEAAAAWVASNITKAEPVSGSGYAPHNPFGINQPESHYELLNKNPFDGKFAEAEIAKINQDFANGKGYLYGADGMGGEF